MLRILKRFGNENKFYKHVSGLVQKVPDECLQGYNQSGDLYKGLKIREQGIDVSSEISLSLVTSVCCSHLFGTVLLFTFPTSIQNFLRSID